MILITATKTEAQAFVERYKLQKAKIKSYTYFFNDDMSVFVCGIGVKKSYEACLFLKENFDLKSKKIINVGIAAAPKRFNIGDVAGISKIIYKDEVVELKKEGEILECVDRPQNNEKNTLVDMESFGIYKALKEYDIDFKKIISDYFAPDTISKDFVKKLVKDSLDKLL